jgi:regulator of replication initiation timing
MENDVKAEIKKLRDEIDDLKKHMRTMVKTNRVLTVAFNKLKRSTRVSIDGVKHDVSSLTARSHKHS